MRIRAPRTTRLINGRAHLAGIVPPAASLSPIATSRFHDRIDFAIEHRRRFHTHQRPRDTSFSCAFNNAEAIIAVAFFIREKNKFRRASDA